MKPANEVAAVILWILAGFFILHVMQGTGGQWLKSFISSGSPSPGASTALPTPAQLHQALTPQAGQ